MDGNQKRQFEYLTEISTVFGRRVRETSCPKTHALYTFAASFMKSIEYSLPVTCLSLHQWDTILKPAISPSLQRSGISRSAPRIPLYAPTLYGGFGWKHPFHLQGLAHVSTFLQELVSNSQTGSLLYQSYEALIMEAGVPIEMGTTDFDRYSRYLTPSWLLSTWNYVHTHGITLLADVPDLPLLRDNDSYLMDLFTTSGFTGSQLALLNQIRLRLRVITVADITTPDGLHITPQAFLCERGNGLREHLSWPRPLPMRARYRRLWQQALRQSLLTAPSRARTLLPGVRVGGWFTLPVFSLWPWRFSEESRSLYRWYPGGWTEFRPVHGITRTLRYRACLRHLTAPPVGPLHLATVSREPNGTLLLVNTSPLAYAPPPADAF